MIGDEDEIDEFLKWLRASFDCWKPEEEEEDEEEWDGEGSLAGHVSEDETEEEGSVVGGDLED